MQPKANKTQKRVMLRGLLPEWIIMKRGSFLAKSAGRDEA